MVGVIVQNLEPFEQVKIFSNHLTALQSCPIAPLESNARPTNFIHQLDEIVKQVSGEIALLTSEVQ